MIKAGIQVLDDARRTPVNPSKSDDKIPLVGGLLLVMGPLVKAIVAGQETSSPVPGTSDFGAGLWGIGIPPDSIAQYEVALMNKQFLLFVDGAVDDIERAHYALTDTRLLNGTLHHGTLDYGSN